MIIGSALAAVLASIAFLWASSRKTFKDISISGKTIQVEVVAGSRDMERGLIGRKSLCSDCGMLFSFSKKGKYSFHMEGMRFDLDLAWIADGQVVGYQESVSHLSDDILLPDTEVDQVLELNAGSIRGLDISVGDRLIEK